MCEKHFRRGSKYEIRVYYRQRVNFTAFCSISGDGDSVGRSSMNLKEKTAMKKRIRAHLRDVRMYRTLGFRYDSAHGGRFVVDEKEFFEVAER